MSHHIWWVPSLMLWYFTYYWLSKTCNDNPTLHWYQNKWMWYSYMVGALCPLWAFVSVVSRNLMWDGMLYDSILVITFVSTMMYLGDDSKLQWQQWLGLILATIGMILMKIHFKN